MKHNLSLKRTAAVLLFAAMMLTLAVAGAQTRITRIRTNEKGVSLRSGPGQEYRKLAGIHAGVELEVLETSGGWYYVYHEGNYGYVTTDSRYVTIIATDTEEENDNGIRQNGDAQPSFSISEPYDMGVPYLGSRSIRLNEMTVFWVQTQMKATGVWYQGESWDVTGNLGDHTMSEIRAFMQSRGYPGHSGQVDQRVVDELAGFLGSRLEPVYVGGFYDAMNSIMADGSAGTMYRIDSNLTDMVPRVTAGARWIQTVLKALGYYSGTIDGMYGEGTDRAVREFQRSHGFQERDYVTLGVARAMLEQYCYRGFSVWNLP